MLLLTRAGVIVEANPAAMRRLRRLGPLAGRSLQELVGDDEEHVARYLRACAGSGEFVLGSLALLDEHGTTLMRAEGAAVGTGGGERAILLRLAPQQAVVREFVHLNQRIDALGAEIVRRRQVEAALREQEERLRVTLASIGDAVIATDSQGCVTYCNGVAATLTGWELEEARGQPLVRIFRIVDERSGAPADDIVATVLREGRVVGLANHTLLISKDGQQRPIADSAAPIRGDDGSVIGVILVFHDVTESRTSQRLTRESEERYRALLDATTAIVWVSDRDGNLVPPQPSWSRYTGQSDAELTGLGWLDALHADDRDAVAAGWRQARSSVDFYQAEARLWHAPTGEYRRVDTRAVPLRNGDGTIREWVGMCVDVEDRRRAEDALRESDRRKDEFLATLAHELRNPLAPILHSLGILEHAGEDRALSARAINMMKRQLGQMVRLIDDLLDASRISRGKLELRLDVVELASAIDHAVETVRRHIDAKEQKLTVLLPPEPLYVRADTVRIAQVFANLLSNASKFTDPGRSIRVRASREDGEAVVRITDEGMGIAAEHMSSIFEMFTQLDNTLERAQSGLGIGLTLAQRLAEMHGGTLTADSPGLGGGSTFTVRLPLSDAYGAASAAKTSAGRSDTERPLTILVADDNRDSADGLAMLLRLMGHTVAAAYDGEEAFARAQELQPDIVILDIGMPRRNGYETCRMIRQQPWGRNALLVALTGWGQDEDRRRTREAGFDAHVVKPVSGEELERLISRQATEPR